MCHVHRVAAASCLLLLSSVPIIHALLQPVPRDALRRKHIGTSPTTLGVFFSNDGKEKVPEVNGRANADLFKTMELKDEALMQAQTAVSSLESALESAVTNLENMQQQLQLQVVQLEQELEATKLELGRTQSELGGTQAELQKTQEELVLSREELAQMEVALEQSREAAKRADQLEEIVATMKEMEEETAPAPAAKKEMVDNPFQPFFSAPKVIPVLNEWIAIKGTNEGEIQISGKVTNHGVIPDNDAIVTSPLMDPNKAAEKKIVTTLSGSKYRLGTPMTMPASDSQSQQITSPEKRKNQPLVKARSSISLPDLSGNTLGSGKYLLAGEAVSSINGRSYIQTAYKSSPFGKPMGEPLAIKFSENTDAMKREFANYQKVASGLKRGSFIRRVDFLPEAGEEMPDKSALVMQRGVADVKAFMPKVGGRLEGELLVDCALTALKCVEALHGVRLVWNDLKTENFVVIEDTKGGVSFRGIDLESCMPVRTPPVDYTPEACPPEFAQSFLDGDAESFSLEYSYDVWSYGMFLYEIASGRGFFDGYSAEKITKSLPTFRPNIDKIEDPQLADLISQCLSRDPSERPSIGRIFKHPFFANASSSKTPFDFLFGI
ncbi:hypothetical protein ACHAXT_011543 [Thalassiosira profunda]